MKNKGYTLIEILIAISIISIVLSSIVAMFTSSLQNSADMQKKIAMQQNGRAALNFIANEIKMAGYSPTSNGGGITTAGLNDIRFTKDINNDGNFNGPNEDIRFFFNSSPPNNPLSTNNRLMMSFIDESGVSDSAAVLDNVESFRVLYAYDIEGLGSAGYGRLEANNSDDIKWTYDSDSDGILDNYYTFSNNSINPGPNSDNRLASPFFRDLIFRCSIC